jgi:hypothetical protein
MLTREQILKLFDELNDELGKNGLKVTSSLSEALQWLSQMTPGRQLAMSTPSSSVF